MLTEETILVLRNSLKHYQFGIAYSNPPTYTEVERMVAIAQLRAAIDILDIVLEKKTHLNLLSKPMSTQDTSAGLSMLKNNITEMEIALTRLEDIFNKDFSAPK